MTHIILFNAFMFAACGYALWAGGGPERWTALVFIVGAFATYAVPDFYRGRAYAQVEPILLLVDATMLFALIAIAVRADRFWPLYVTALHLITVAVHGVKGLQADLVPWMYAAASSKIAYPMLVLLAIGALRHRNRLAQFGSDRDWSDSREAGSEA
jgi:hypothetical protein